MNTTEQQVVQHPWFMIVRGAAIGLIGLLPVVMGGLLIAMVLKQRATLATNQ